MPTTRIAKLFKNGASQAVRLPAEFRFEGNEVFATRDEKTGDVVLSSRPGASSWKEFFELVSEIDVPNDFMSDRPMKSDTRRTRHLWWWSVNGLLDAGHRHGEYIIRGRSATVAARLSEISPSNVCISVVTRAELRYGLKSLPPDHRLHDAVERFLAVIDVPCRGARLRRIATPISRYYLVTTGQPIGEMDMMIAALCGRRGRRPSSPTTHVISSEFRTGRRSRTGAIDCHCSTGAS